MSADWPSRTAGGRAPWLLLAVLSRVGCGTVARPTAENDSAYLGEEWIATTSKSEDPLLPRKAVEGSCIKYRDGPRYGPRPCLHAPMPRAEGIIPLQAWRPDLIRSSVIDIDVPEGPHMSVSS